MGNVDMRKISAGLLLLALVMTTIPTSNVQCALSAPACNAGWVPYSGNCYRVFNQTTDRLHWTNAELFCQTNGAYLVNIGDQQENDFISSQLIVHGLKGLWVSIGLREDRSRDMYNVWRWSPSQTLPTFTQWAGGDTMGESKFAYLIVDTDPRLSIWKSNNNLYTQFVCETGCGWPTIADDSKVAVMGETSFTGAQITYSCPANYFLLGREQGTCGGDALWSDPAPDCVESSSCPAGWVQYATNCYRANNISLSWDDAEGVCGNDGAYLTNIADQAENQLLGNLLYTLNLVGVPLWFGLSEERVFSSNGDWRWRPRGTTLSYSAWATSEPQNIYPWDCAAIQIASGGGAQAQWYDFRCDEKKPFICERGCHEPSLNTDNVQQIGNSSHTNSTLRYECGDGYTISGETTIMCLNGGHWDATRYPMCEPARGARTECNDTHMTVAVGRFDLAGFAASSIHLLDSNCTFMQNASHYYITTLLDGGCDTTRIVTDKQVEYRNRILYSTGTVNISVACIIKSTRNLTLAIALEERDPITMTARPGTRNYDVSFNAYNDSSYIFAYVRSIFPTPLFTTEMLFMSAAVKTTSRHVTGVKTTECWATPGDQQAQPQVVFLRDGCPTSAGEVLLYDTTDSKSTNFSLTIGDHISSTFAQSLFYLHCSVRVCHGDDVDSNICTKSCATGSGVRRRRAEATRDVQAGSLEHVSAGPFSLRNSGSASNAHSASSSPSTAALSVTGSIASIIGVLVVGMLYRRRQRSSARHRALLDSQHYRHNSASALVVLHNDTDAESSCNEIGELSGARTFSDTASICTQMTMMDEDMAEKDLEDVF